MKKVYLIEDISYGELCWENDTVGVREIFEDEDKAIERFKEMINNTINHMEGYVLDSEDDINNIKVGDIIRFFWKEQENWSMYFELHLVELEVR